MKYLLAALLLTLIAQKALGVDCSSTNITLNTQLNVDNFQGTYGPCDHVRGDLHVEGNDIWNIDGLYGLVSVGEDLRVWNNPLLTDVDGLSNILSTDYLSIDDNSELTNIDGLSSLISVSSHLKIWNNNKLANVDGLNNLSSVDSIQIVSNDALLNVDGLSNLLSTSSLSITHNEALQNLNALSNLTDVSSLDIRGNTSLLNVDGLSNVSSSLSSLYLRLNPLLEDLDALSGVAWVDSARIESNDNLLNVNGLNWPTRMTGDLVIQGNDELKNLDGLRGLEEIDGDLILVAQIDVSSLDGLYDLKRVGNFVELALTADNIDGLINLLEVGGSLKIWRQDYVPDCTALVRLLGWPSGLPSDNVGGDIIFEQNDSGCQSVEEILSLVSGPDEPVITSALGGNHQISVEFEESVTTDRLYPIQGYQAVCIGQNVEDIHHPDVPILIPDEGSISDQFEILEFAPVSGSPAIEVDVDITHPRTRHLALSLTSPMGTSITLWDQGVGAGSDLVGTFPTTLTPVDDLSQLEIEELNGTWSLRVEDVVAGFEGSLNSWGIRVLETVEEFGPASPIVLDEVNDETRYACTLTPKTLLGIFPVSNELQVTLQDMIFKDGFE